MTKENWNKFYDEKGRFYLTPHEGFKRTINRFKSYNVIDVLDLGCGSGRHLIPLAENSFKVAGIDYSPSAAALAERWLHSKQLPGKVYIADVHEKIKYFEDQSFDAVLAVNSIHYGSLENFTSTILEINRLLKTGGLLYLVTPSVNTIIRDLQTEQLFFEDQNLKLLLEKTFRILEFRHDDEERIVIIAQEK